MRRVLVPALMALAVLAPGCGDSPARIHAPDGVRVRTVARGIPHPSNIVLDRGGAMWLTSSGYQAGPGDGVWRVARAGARPRHVVRGLESALGLAWHRGELYVSYIVRRHGRVRGHVAAFSRFDGRRFRRRRTVLAGLPAGVHNVDSIAAGPDGRMYLGIGSREDTSPGPDPRAASVVSFRPNGRDLRVEARGLRNPYGLAFLPGRRELLVTDNGRDDLGLRRPPDELNLVVTGRRRAASYGFPGCWGQGGPACRGKVAALARLAPHTAAAGVAVARRFGRYGLSAFVAEYGSSFPRNPTGSDVVRVSLRRRAGRWVVSVHPFARGFSKRGPVGAAIGPDGALYVTQVEARTVVRFAPRPPVHPRSTKS